VLKSTIQGYASIFDIREEYKEEDIAVNSTMSYQG
jgi:hypothetical protein